MKTKEDRAREYAERIAGPKATHWDLRVLKAWLAEYRAAKRDALPKNS